MYYKEVLDYYHRIYTNIKNLLLEELRALLNDDSICGYSYFKKQDDSIILSLYLKVKKNDPVNNRLNIEEYDTLLKSYHIGIDHKNIKEIYNVIERFEKAEKEYTQRRYNYMKELDNRVSYINNEILELVKKIVNKQNIEVDCISLNDDNIEIKVIEHLDVKFGDSTKSEIIKIYNTDKDIEKVEIASKIYELEKERKSIKDFLGEW